MVKRNLSDEDRALWQRIAANVVPLKRAANIEPLKRTTKRVVKAPVPPTAASAPAKAIKLKVERPQPAPRAAPPVVVVSAAPATPGLDRRTTSKLRRGHIVIEAKLDLHGMTQSEAHDALLRFIASSRERGLRCVIVVTGVGKAGGGVLRRAVPRWLSEAGPREAVISFAAAEQRHGGDGALYVMLRKKR